MRNTQESLQLTSFAKSGGGGGGTDGDEALPERPAVPSQPAHPANASSSHLCPANAITSHVLRGSPARPSSAICSVTREGKRRAGTGGSTACRPFRGLRVLFFGGPELP
ncbi:hypothetical protein AAFF_G00135000 [Aldrovandia affinis]|uniref:Uncharacterized protein n=1 Tax=Aldrovandia affinis TaxID=143900 RepID=A0AAD7W8X4_9TELE|nr:hypothetical protein AAFF_G00135000 [Aldrovandia affinis]